jgi:hypothetical protein
MAGLAARYFWIALMRSGATAISFAMVIVLLFLGYRPRGGLETQLCSSLRTVTPSKSVTQFLLAKFTAAPEVPAISLWPAFTCYYAGSPHLSLPQVRLSIPKSLTGGKNFYDFLTPTFMTAV